MSGILARYLSGIGTDPLNQQGGMEGFMSQYNVNPYWQQFLQNGNPGLLGQQQYTQGGQNPYYQNENVYKPETPVEGAQPATPQYGGLGDLTPAMFRNGLRYDDPNLQKVNGYQTVEFNPQTMTYEQRKALEGYNIGQGSAIRGGYNQTYAIPQELYLQAAQGDPAGMIDRLMKGLKV